MSQVCMFHLEGNRTLTETLHHILTIGNLKTCPPQWHTSYNKDILTSTKPYLPVVTHCGGHFFSNHHSWRAEEVFCHQTGRCRVESFSCWFLVLLWSFSYYAPFPPFWNGKVYPVPFYIQSMWAAFWFWFYRRLQLRDCYEFLKKLWTFKQHWDCNRIWGLKARLNEVFALYDYMLTGTSE